MPTIYQRFIDPASGHYESRPGSRLAGLPVVISSSLASSTPLSQRFHQRDLHEASQQESSLFKQQSQQLQASKRNQSPLDAFFKTDDPVLLKWLQAMRFETELECLSALQARSLAVDEHSAAALAVRNSQLTIQELRLESNFILDYTDYLVDALPLQAPGQLAKFSLEFSELWTRLMKQTAPTSVTQDQQQILASNVNGRQNNLTIINCTPRKSRQAPKTSQVLGRLASSIRELCVALAQDLHEAQEATDSSGLLDSSSIAASLKRIKELYGRYVETSIRSECANIVRALNFDFSNCQLKRLSSTASLQPVRPFESSSGQLPLKWALIALWQLTKDDSYICRVLTEKWQTSSPARRQIAKRLDYSTKYDLSSASSDSSGPRSDYEQLYQICRPHQQQQQQLDQENRHSPTGALSNALEMRQLSSVREISTIELLIEVIISQPNKHERLDMMNFIHSQAQVNKLIDIDEWDQTVSAAIYTSNQFKVAALRILNHLCVNEQAVKTILKCFSTPPPAAGQMAPENKIIRSIFECYQNSQEHIYQNETMFHSISAAGAQRRGRKRNRQFDEEEHSDYGSCRPSSSLDPSSLDADEHEDGDDVVVKEAIRLLVQLTDSFHRSNRCRDFYTLIGRFSIDSLVKYLTSIVQSTNSREMLHLCLTALGNISFATTEPIVQYGTNRIILEMFRSSRSRSKDLELRDQAVTILANTADKNILDIVSNGGIGFLLSCLESCPTKMANHRLPIERSKRADEFTSSADLAAQCGLDNKPRDRKPINLADEYAEDLDCLCNAQHYFTQDQLCAIERIHQKSAVAFARMSADPSTTRMVLKYGGVKQMIDLCKFSHLRNHSDTVLIACMAALRKMARVIESEIFRHYHALDLIELEFNQALEIYGSHSRSKVV